MVLFALSLSLDRFRYKNSAFARGGYSGKWVAITPMRLMVSVTELSLLTVKIFEVPNRLNLPGASQLNTAVQCSASRLIDNMTFWAHTGAEETCQAPSNAASTS